jgi:GT2 family glycosyltransferase
MRVISGRQNYIEVRRSKNCAYLSGATLSHEGTVPAIVVAIPTYRRPLGLQKLLTSLALLDTDRQLSVVVADNDDAMRQGADVCYRMMADNYRWKLSVITVAERGVAQTRNALVGYALQDPETRYIAMLDDDEWPEPQWLETLLRTQHETGAEVVRGTILRDFEITPPVWSSGWDGIAPISNSTAENGMFEGIGNVLISRHCFEAVSQPCFDPSFGLTGGEDKDFFVRLRALGARFAWADGATVFEHVPASRARLGWSLLRAYRTGNTDMRLALKYGHVPANVVKEIAKVIAAFVLFPMLSIAFSLAPRRRLEGLRRVYRAAGKIGALFGHRYHEYSAHHGR